MAEQSALFLKACGSVGSLRLVLEQPERAEAQTLSFPVPFVIVGRDERADLQLDHPDVSRRHAYLQLINGQLLCVDLLSRTGTRWAEEPRFLGWAERGQSLGVGPFQLRLSESGSSTVSAHAVGTGQLALPTSQAFDQSDLPEASLEVLGSSVTKATWRIGRALVLLGRTRPCWVRLPSRDVSRIHCSLVRTPSGIWVVDLLSREGVFVNEQRVRYGYLQDGDELRIGPHHLRLRLHSTAIRSAWPSSLVGRPAGAFPALRPESPQYLATRPDEAQVLANRAEIADSLLVPLLSELGQMQQQMADQFNQALMMMFQMFSSMHKDQMGLIREELAQIQQLTREQQALQAELAKRPVASSPDVLAPPFRVVPAVSDTAPGLVEELGHIPFPGPACEAPAPPGAAPVEPTGFVPGAAPRMTGRADEGLGRSPTDDTRNVAEDHVHAMLVQRLAAIQDERQTRWQKLLKSVMGKNASGG